MRFRILILIILWCANRASGQEPPLPSATATPAATPSARPELNIPDIPVEPQPLVPNTSPGPKKTVPTITELDSAFQQSSLGQAVEQQRLQLEWRKLKNRAGQESDVIAAKNAIATGRTDEEKRDLRRAYYKLFYGRMQTMADNPNVKTFVEQQKKAILDSLEQPHVRPKPSPQPTRR